MLGEVLTAIVTPFRADGSVDLDRFRELAEFLVENGSDGIVVCGTTGESPTLRDGEKFELWETAVEALGGRATVVAGTGTYDTAHSIHLTERATEIGVDALLVVTPYYNRPPQRAIVAHFEAIADASDRPIVAYNIPSRVVINIEPETIERLAQIPTVRAVKQAHADLEQARQIPGFGLDLYAGRRLPDAAVPRARRPRRHLRARARRRAAGEGDGARVPQRRPRAREGDRRSSSRPHTSS